jgi:hypothetical protein
MRQDSVDTFSRAPLLDQADQPHQVLHTKPTATTADHNHRIRTDDIRPTCWQPFQHSLLVVEVDPLLPPRQPVFHHLVLATEAWMKRVSHAKNASSTGPIMCT